MHVEEGVEGVLENCRRVVAGGQAKTRWAAPKRSLALKDTQSPCKGQVCDTCASALELNFELEMLLASARFELGANASD